MSDPNGLLAAVVAAVTLPLIRPGVRAYVASFNRHLMPPAAAGARAPRGGRAPRPVVSPAAGDPAAEAASPDVHASAAEENQR
jgi:hypothetical protein